MTDRPHGCDIVYSRHRLACGCSIVEYRQWEGDAKWVALRPRPSYNGRSFTQQICSREHTGIRQMIRVQNERFRADAE